MSGQILISCDNCGKHSHTAKVNNRASNNSFSMIRKSLALKGWISRQDGTGVFRDVCKECLETIQKNLQK